MPPENSIYTYMIFTQICTHCCNHCIQKNENQHLCITTNKYTFIAKYIKHHRRLLYSKTN